MSLPAKKDRYTYTDYLQREGPERFELIDGKAVMLAGCFIELSKVLPT
ncbi:hypothetical protein [Flintibacter muris]|nr:hypothetical protein [Flintibacter muris]